MNSGQMTSISTASTSRLRAAVLRVHGKDDEVLESVFAVLLGLEGEQRVQEVGDTEPGVHPAHEVDAHELKVAGIVREARCQGFHGLDDGKNMAGRSTVVRSFRYGTVLDLKAAQCRGGGLETLPFGVVRGDPGGGGGQR